MWLFMKITPSYTQLRVFAVLTVSEGHSKQLLHGGAISISAQAGEAA
jgi:hypothetical protein